MSDHAGPLEVVRPALMARLREVRREMNAARVQEAAGNTASGQRMEASVPK